MTRKLPPWESACLTVAASAPLAWVLVLEGFGRWFPVATQMAALVLWAFHLRRSGLRLGWSLIAVFGLGSLFAAQPAGRLDISALGEAVFLYVLLWLLSEYDQQPGLQAIAAAALLMSAGVLTKPPIAISCVLVGLMFFLLHRPRRESGGLDFAFLMFTPATLCIVSTCILAIFSGGVLGASVLVPYSHLWPGSQPDRSGMAWLMFPAAVVVYRFHIRKMAASDIAFGLMLITVSVLSFLTHMPQPVHRIDIFYLSSGGAAALLAQAPPQRYLGGFLYARGAGALPVQAPPKRHFGSVLVCAILFAAIIGGHRTAGNRS
jgi:hypothetical protein